jgi:hypothetical protein
MAGASSAGTDKLCTVAALTEGGGKPRAPCSSGGGGGGGTGGGSGGGGGGGISLVGAGADFDWGFPLTGIGGGLASSFSSLSSSSSSSSLGTEVGQASQLTALVDGVMGVMTSECRSVWSRSRSRSSVYYICVHARLDCHRASFPPDSLPPPSTLHCAALHCTAGVKTLGRHPVLATVLWLLGGSVEDNDKENSARGSNSTASSSSSSGGSSNYHRQQQRQQAQYQRKQQQQHHHHHQHDHTHHHDVDGSVRRLRWKAGASPPDANANDRIVYYLDRPVRACVRACVHYCIFACIMYYRVACVRWWLSWWWRLLLLRRSLAGKAGPRGRLGSILIVTDTHTRTHTHRRVTTAGWAGATTAWGRRARAGATGWCMRTRRYVCVRAWSRLVLSGLHQPSFFCCYACIAEWIDGFNLERRPSPPPNSTHDPDPVPVPHRALSPPLSTPTPLPSTLYSHPR